MQEGKGRREEEQASVSAGNQEVSPESLANRMVEGLAAGTSDEAVAQILRSEPQQVAERAVSLLPAIGKEKALPLLSRLAKSQQEDLATSAAEAMGKVPDPEAARLLTRLAETTSSKAVRKAAKRSLHRLQSMGVAAEPEPVAAPEQPAKTTSITRAIVTSMDGAGNRLIWLIADRALGGVRLLSLLVNDETGIEEVVETDVTRQDFEEELERKSEDPRFSFVEIPVDYAIQLVEEARARNRETDTPLPREFHAWRRIIGTPSRHYEKPLTYEGLRPIEVQLNPSYLSESGNLLEEPELLSWVLPLEKIQKYAEEIRNVRESRVFLPNVTKEERENSVISQAISELFGGAGRKVMKRRLEEMAYVLLVTGRDRSARLALAVALEMENPDLGALTRIPFLRSLVQTSIQLHLMPYAGLRVAPGRSSGIPDIVIPR